VGASLLANVMEHPALMLTDKALSRAGSLPQVLIADIKKKAGELVAHRPFSQR
jgi:hypothetical protein